MKALALLLGTLAAPLLATSANATVTIYLQEDGNTAATNYGKVTYIGSGASGASFGPTQYGTFDSVQGSAVSYGSTPNFTTQTMDAKSSSSGTLTVYLVNSGLMNLASALTSTFTANGLGDVSSVQESTFLSSMAFDPMNVAGTIGTMIGDYTFSSSMLGSGSVNQSSPTTNLASYSEITRYVIKIGANGGTANSTINIAAGAVPEPASWAMMLVGFGLIGATLRQRRPARVSFG